MNSILVLLLSIPGILVATTIHEFTRAAVSTALGDLLPKERHRLSLNPFNHFEPVGFLLLLGTGFGWGKPVETSGLYYKNRKRDNMLVATIPTIANFIAAVIFIFVLKRVGYGNAIVFMLFRNLVYYNICLFVYNFIPVSPMDCVRALKIIMPSNDYFKYIQYEKVIQMIFLMFLFFGWVSIITGPIISGLMTLLDIIVF